MALEIGAGGHAERPVKILHTVQRYHPDVGGSEEVVRQISEHLAAFGHEVVVATSASPERRTRTLNGVTIEEFRCGGNAVEGISGDAEKFRKFVAGCGADVMMNYAAQIWSTDLFFDLLPSLRMKKVLVPCGYSRLRDPRFAGYFNALPRVLAHYDAVIYLSDNYIDAAFGREHGLRNGIMIPNAASAAEFPFTGPPRRGLFRGRHGIGERCMLLNVSNHSSLKNHAFFWSCARSLGAEAFAPVLIGNAYKRGPRKWLTECFAACRVAGMRRGALLIENAPRHEVVEAYHDADAFLFGSLVECSPLVMFEAFASRTLFVTTDCGNVRDHAEAACVVDGAAEAVDVLREFRESPGRYHEKIDRGFALFRERLNWERIAREYESLYRMLVAGGSLVAGPPPADGASA